jgi:hypothetical protein
VLILSGCALKYLNMARFDNNEYLLSVEVRTQANLGARKCGTPEVNQEVTDLWTNSLNLKNYSESIANNEETVLMTGELLEIIRGLYVRYNIDKKDVSMTYCTNKFILIEKNATVISNTIAKKPR